MLQTIQGVKLENHDRRLTKSMFDLLKDAMPMKLQSVRILLPGRMSVAGLLLPIALWMMGPTIRRISRMHRNGLPPDYLFDFKQLGMTAEGLPPALGGTFDALEFQKRAIQRK